MLIPERLQQKRLWLQLCWQSLPSLPKPHGSIPWKTETGGSQVCRQVLLVYIWYLRPAWDTQSLALFRILKSTNRNTHKDVLLQEYEKDCSIMQTCPLFTATPPYSKSITLNGKCQTERTYVEGFCFYEGQVQGHLQRLNQEQLFTGSGIDGKAGSRKVLGRLLYLSWGVGCLSECICQN